MSDQMIAKFIGLIGWGVFALGAIFTVAALTHDGAVMAAFFGVSIVIAGVFCVGVSRALLALFSIRDAILDEINHQRRLDRDAIEAE